MDDASLGLSAEMVSRTDASVVVEVSDWAPGRLGRVVDRFEVGVADVHGSDRVSAIESELRDRGFLPRSTWTRMPRPTADVQRRVSADE